MTPFYFLSLLALVYGELIIDITVTTDRPFIDIRNFISTEVISDVERETFGIQDEQLKKALANYTDDNTEPDFVYVKKTGKDNDLYVNYEDFNEMKRTVKPIYVDATIGTPDCTTSDKPIKIGTNWSINGELTVADKIAHNVYYNDTIILNTVSDWGVNVFEPKSGNYVEVCTISVTIDYVATIAGDVAADYTKKRTSKDGAHHFYAYDVFNVLKAAGLKQSVVNSETITVTYPKMPEISGSNTSSTTPTNN